MRDQRWFRGTRRAGLAVGTLLVVVSGCGGSSTDGFTAEEWKRIEMIQPLGTPMLSNPYDDRADDDEVASFGQTLFYEKDFAEGITAAGPSGNVGDLGKVGCVTCHDNKYFADSRQIKISHGRSWSSRNTGQMVNLGWYEWTLWTGTFDSMMGHGSNVWGTSATPLAQMHFVYKKYRDKYNELFPMTPLDDALDLASPQASRFPATGGPKSGPNAADGPFEKMTKADQWKVHEFRANLGKIFDAYPRKLTTPNSNFERYIKGEKAADRSEANFSLAAKRGLKLFIGKASCIDCHNGPLLSDNQFHNIGVEAAPVYPPWTGVTMKPAPDRGRAGTLQNLLITTLATLRANDGLVKGDATMDQAVVFTGGGQFSADPDGGRKRLENLDAQLCKPDGHNTDATFIQTVCSAIFKAPRMADDTKTPPVTMDPGDPRWQVCVENNSAKGLCGRLDASNAVVGNFDSSMEGAFRTPGLLNVAQTGPYFHTGEAATLKDVVWHYNNGGGTPGMFVGTKSPRIRPLGLTESEMNDLVEFLMTLSGDAPEARWACNPLVGPDKAPNGCGPVGAGGGTGGATGAGGGGGGGGAKGGASGTAGAAGGGMAGKGGGGASAGGATGTGGSVVSSGGAWGAAGAAGGDSGAGGMSSGGAGGV